MIDLMNITVETGDEFLDKKLNSHICYGGGGGNATTTTADIPEWLKPHAQKFLGAAGRAHSGGELSKVAGLNLDQQKALGQGRNVAGVQDQLAQQAIQRNQELYNRPGADTDRLRSDFLNQARRGAGQAGAGSDAAAASRGTLGGARSEAARAAGQAQAQEQAALGFTQAAQQAQQQDFANKAQLASQTGQLQQQAGTGAQTLGKVGQVGQQQAQREADATWQGLQRFGQLLGQGSGFGTGRTSEQGGGK